MHSNNTKFRSRLRRIARQALIERGLLPDFSPQVLSELEVITGPAEPGDPPVRDLRNLAWCSIDNDDSRDLDQLTVSEPMADGSIKILVAVADVDAVVRHGTAIDGHARHNTTSIYTAAETFPMLPEKLSTDITSLNSQRDRLAIVIQMIIADGTLQNSDICRAIVCNHAKLSYNSIAEWLEGTGPMPEGIALVNGLDENLRTQDRVAHHMKLCRHLHGALDLETIEACPIFDADQLKDLAVERKNRAKELIEDLMIAANGVTARYLAARGVPSIRRVVRTPKRWDRIVEIGAERGVTLPRLPDPKALEQFLSEAKSSDPAGFPDLSLVIIKLLGPGEYTVEFPGDTAEGHFGLAVRDYTHSTAPNRRYPDLITQRLLKAAIAGGPVPYTDDELKTLAVHCTKTEDIVKKAERLVGKSAAAMLLERRIGEQFDAIVTGAAPKGTWVRLLHPPVEGRLVRGFEGMDVGRKLRVQLVYTDVERGHIDFKRVPRGS